MPIGLLGELAGCFSKQSRLNVKESFRALRSNNDKPNYRLAGQVMEGNEQWLEKGIID